MPAAPAKPQIVVSIIPPKNYLQAELAGELLPVEDLDGEGRYRIKLTPDQYCNFRPPTGTVVVAERSFGGRRPVVVVETGQPPPPTATKQPVDPEP